MQPGTSLVRSCSLIDVVNGRRPRMSALSIIVAALAVTSLVTGCTTAPSVERASLAVPPPWSEPALDPAAVPGVFVEAWRAAENATRCAPLGPERLDPVLQQAARPRAATFSGGWGVAYDLPETRSAFGIAGTGASAWNGDVYDGWPHRRVFADSSRVGYGLEGGTGANWLAYIRIPGQDCLYNVWSRRGREHLEELLGQLRFVKVR